MYVSTEASLITDMICNYSIDEKILMKTQYDKNAPKTKYMGAYNMHLPGVYKNIVIADVSSQYPNCMKSLNISTDTFLEYTEQDFVQPEYNVPLHNTTQTEIQIHLDDSSAKYKGVVRIDNSREGIIIKVINKFLALKNQQNQYKIAKDS